MTVPRSRHDPAAGDHRNVEVRAAQRRAPSRDPRQAADYSPRQLQEGPEAQPGHFPAAPQGGPASDAAAADEPDSGRQRSQRPSGRQSRREPGRLHPCSASALALPQCLGRWRQYGRQGHRASPFARRGSQRRTQRAAAFGMRPAAPRASLACWCSGRQARTALGAARVEDGAPGPGAHAQPESVGLRAPAVVRLEGALAHVWLRKATRALAPAVVSSGQRTPSGGTP